jgi:hypothetical protein
VNTHFELPKIVLKIIVGDIVRDRVTIFLVDGSLDACVILACRGNTDERPWSTLRAKEADKIPRNRSCLRRAKAFGKLSVSGVKLV